MSKPFVKFNPTFSSINQTQFDNYTVSNSTIIQSSDITLHVPYSLAGTSGVVVFILFIIAQYYETKNTKNLTLKLDEAKSEEKEELNKKGSNVEMSRLDKISYLLFNDKHHEPAVFTAKVVETVLFVILCMTIGGFSIVLGNFMLTFITKGPAKLPLDTFFKIQMLFWIFNVFGRLLASVIAFKLNTLLYFFILILLNFICIFLYTIPYLNSMPVFYWFITIPLATVSGPVIPSTIMVAKHIMKQVSSVLISLFGVGLAIGAISIQYLTGFLLDEFIPDSNLFGYNDATSAYIIPIIILISVSVSFLVYLVLILVYKRFKYKNRNVS